MLETKTCPECNRDFALLFSQRNGYRCLNHCGNPCCRKAGCPNTVATQAASRATGQHAKRCKVCGRPGEMFERFAPCNKHDLHPVGCAGDKPQTEYHGRQWGCWGQFYPEGSFERNHFHHPIEKPRYHIGYCSLACFNSVRYGHQQKVQHRWRKDYYRYGRQARWRRQELASMGPGAKFLPVEEAKEISPIDSSEPGVDNTPE